MSTAEGEGAATAKALGWDQAQHVSRMRRPRESGQCGKEEGRGLTTWHREPESECCGKPLNDIREGLDVETQLEFPFCS